VKNVVETHQAALELLPGAYVHLRYEDLLKESKVQMGRVWSLLGASLESPGLWENLDQELQQNPDAEWQHQKAGDIADSMQKGKSGSWRNLFTERDKRLFWKIAGKTLSEWGYETA
jgi:hypothetical protein